MAKTQAEEAAAILARGVMPPDAPVLFVDNILNFGSGHGFVHATLTTTRFTLEEKRLMVVGHLRLTVPAARQLADSLQKVLAMLEKPSGSLS
jgi:hypothetical protein